MLVIHQITIDLVKPGPQPVVAAVQGEANTRKIAIALFSNHIAWHIPAGATAALAFLKPDGTRGLYDKLPDGSPAASILSSTVTVTLAPQVLTCAGTVLASVVFYDADMDTLATFPFRIFVEQNPAAGAELSNNYYTLQNLDQVNAAYDAMLERVNFLAQQVEAGIGVTDEQIAAVVESYLEENPPEAVTEGQIAAVVERYMEENPVSGTVQVTAATPGQTVVVKTVDGNGVPTAWETAALPTDDHINTLIDTALGVIENGSY